MVLKDQRIKMMNEVLNGIKVLKLYAWEIAFIRRINEIREKELKCIRQKAIISAFSSAIWSFAPIIVHRFFLNKTKLKLSFSRYALQRLLHMYYHPRRIF
jgi:hypothetical protein